MKKIEQPTKIGLYGNSTSQWKHIEFVVVYRSKIGGPLRSKISGSTHLGLRLTDHGADCEWYKLSWWDHIKFTLAEMFGKHNWPKRMLRVKK
jgi:hypothetical protein